jgi:hypothetical protein
VQHVTLLVLGAWGGGWQELGEDAGSSSSGRTAAPGREVDGMWGAADLARRVRQRELSGVYEVRL